MTTKNILRNSSETCKCRNSSTKIIWPVLLMGNHSVTPSTIPKIIAFKISSILYLRKVIFPCFATDFPKFFHCRIQYSKFYAKRKERMQNRRKIFGGRRAYGSFSFLVIWNSSPCTEGQSWGDIHPERYPFRR